MARTIIYKLYQALRGVLLEVDLNLDDHLTAEEQSQLMNIYLKIKTQIFGDDD